MFTGVGAVHFSMVVASVQTTMRLRCDDQRMILQITIEIACHEAATQPQRRG